MAAREKLTMQRYVTQKQRMAIELLLEGLKHIEVSRALGLRRETLWRWRQRPAFIREFNKMMKRRARAARQRLVVLAERCITAIEGQLTRPLSEFCDWKRIDTAVNALKMLGYERETPLCDPILPRMRWIW